MYLGKVETFRAFMIDFSVTDSKICGSSCGLIIATECIMPEGSIKLTLPHLIQVIYPVWHNFLIHEWIFTVFALFESSLPQGFDCRLDLESSEASFCGGSQISMHNADT